MTSALRLSEQQRWFALSTTDPAGVHAGSERASHALARSLPIEQCLTDGPRLRAADRLAIYSQGYFARLVECLADDFPALQHLLGADGFESLAHAYIDAFPSRSASLNAYGSRMAAFCRTRAEPWAPFAADLARLEWAVVEVIHARSAAGLDAEALSRIPPARWQTARLVPSPTLRLLSFDYPVNEFYRAFKANEAPERPERHASSTAVFRQGLPVMRMGLEPSAAHLLEDLLAGCPLDSAVAELERRSQGGGSVVEKLPVWLGSWVASGFFSAIEY